MQRLVLVAARGFVAAIVTALVALPAEAGDNDIVLSRLGDPVGQGVRGNNPEFRSMVSELGVVLAPRLLSPADTLGFGGFQFAADLGFTTISRNASYWRVLQGSAQPDGTGPHGSATLSTVGVFARKGMWLPLPSFEMGAGLVHLTGSRMMAAQGYAKFALHEGYHHLPLPSLAARAAVSRMMGEPDLDLTVVSGDLSLSKEIGIGGIVNLAPYAGWNLLFIIPRSEVIDKTPNVAGDLSMNFVFSEQDAILRHRVFGGLRLKYHVFAVMFEADVALAGTSKDDRPGTDQDCASMPSSYCDSTDRSGAQTTLTLSLGVDF